MQQHRITIAARDVQARGYKDYQKVSDYAKKMRNDPAEQLAKAIIESNDPTTIAGKLKLDKGGKPRCVLYKVSEEEKPSADAATDIVKSVLGRDWSIYSSSSSGEFTATYIGDYEAPARRNELWNSLYMYLPTGILVAVLIGELITFYSARSHQSFP